MRLAVHIDPVVVAETKKRRVTFFSTGYEMVRVEGPEEELVVVAAAPPTTTATTTADNSNNITALDSPISPAPGSFENPLFVQHRSFWNEFHGSIGFFPDENAAETFCELPLISYKRPWNVAEVLPPSSADLLPPGGGGQQQQQQQQQQRQEEEEESSKTSQDECVVHTHNDATGSVTGSANAAAPTLNPSVPSTEEDDLKMLREESLSEAGEHMHIAAHQAACCPWAKFGKKMERAGLGANRWQGGVFLLLFLGALGFYIVFTHTGRPWYIYGTLSLILLMATYAGFCRARMRRRSNTVQDSSEDAVSTIGDHVYRLMCGCCSLCHREARTSNTDHVQNAAWHGPHGDIRVICNHQVVFSPVASGKWSSSSWKMLPLWRIQSAQQPKESAVITVTSDSDIEDQQQAWSREDLESVPLMTLGPS